MTEPHIEVIEDVEGFFERRVKEALEAALKIAEYEDKDLPPVIEIDVKRFRPVPFEYKFEKDKIIFIFQSVTRISKDFGHTPDQITELLLQWKQKR